MAVGFKVKFYWYQIGDSDFLHSFFSNSDCFTSFGKQASACESGFSLNDQRGPSSINYMSKYRRKSPKIRICTG